MRKRTATMTEIKLDKEQKRSTMAYNKPRQNASECFKRPPYSNITRGDDIGKSTTNEQQEV
jgi:hypothetical protein